MSKSNHSLIELCNRFGVRIYRYRFVLWILAGVAVSLVIFSVFFSQEDVYTLGSISLLLWILLIIIFSQVFSWQPPTTDPTDPFFYRLVVKVKRGLFWLMLVILVGLFIFVFFVSTKAVSILL
jgi:hypothetical protein